jgi:hypothetical protein
MNFNNVETIAILHSLLYVLQEGLIATVEGRDLQISTNAQGRSTFSRAAK